MSTIHKCKSFYLKEVIFDLKGELPVYACERGHDICLECNKSCPDLQPIHIQPTTNQHSPQEK